MLRSQRVATTVLLALVCLLGLVVYWPGLHGGYIFDDWPNLIQAQAWRLQSLDWLSLQRVLESNGSGLLGRGLAMLSFGLDYHWAGMAPFAYKLTSVGFHLSNGILAYFLVRGLLQWLPPSPGRATPGVLAALVVATLWLVHPLQVSTVLYVVQRMELGACTGMLLALLGYLHARRAQVAGTRQWPWWLLAVVGMAFGLGFKETALITPALALMLELCLLRFQGREGRRSRTLMTGYAIAAVGALAIYFSLVLPHYLQADAYASRDFTLGQRLLTQLHVLAMYLGWYVLPLPGQFVFYYDNFPISTGLLHPASTLVGLCVLVAFATAAIALRKRWPLTALGIGWFFIGHSLTSNVIPLELVFEHRNYFPLLVILLALVQPAHAALVHLKPALRSTLALAVVAFMSLMCVIQVGVWANPLNQAAYFAARNPSSERANYELGSLLFRMANGDRQSPYWPKAEIAFRKAAAATRATVMGQHMLLLMSSQDTAAQKNKLWQDYRAGLLARAPGPPEISSLRELVDCSINKTCHVDQNQLLRSLMDITAAHPKNTKLLTIYANFAAGVLKDPDLTLHLARDAVAIEPHSLQLEANLGVFYALFGHDKKARELLKHLEQADRTGRYEASWSKIPLLLNRNSASE